MIGSISNTGGWGASSLSQIRERMFSRIDTSGDGSIDKTEMSSFLAENDQTGGSVDDIFSMMDTDGNGSISRTEDEEGQKKLQQQMQMMMALGGLTGTGGMMPPPPPPGSGNSSDDDSSLFSRIDTDGDGVISQSELNAMTETMPKDGLSAGEILGIADTDGDGKISQSEFTSTKDKVREAMDQKMSQNSTFGGDLSASLLEALNESAGSSESSLSSQDLSFLVRQILSSYMQTAGHETDANSLMSSKIYV